MTLDSYTRGPTRTSTPGGRPLTTDSYTRGRPDLYSRGPALDPGLLHPRPDPNLYPADRPGPLGPPAHRGPGRADPDTRGPTAPDPTSSRLALDHGSPSQPARPDPDGPPPQSVLDLYALCVCGLLYALCVCALCMRSVYALCVCGGMRTCEHPTAYGYRIQPPHTTLGGRPRDGSGGGFRKQRQPTGDLQLAPLVAPGRSWSLWWLLVAPGGSWWLLVAPGCPYRSALGSSRDHHQADPGCGRPRCCSCTHSPS